MFSPEKLLPGELARSDQTEDKLKHRGRFPVYGAVDSLKR